ncbi:hypothetical protein QYE76_057839 [Lolium multiflorum]|uniref:Reverse transcriptase zinc-binding domain-containing protein n=1 Tax=Lolium multiflorum TaxID=4521 RepID=A0AAD8T576_LOLMU|nr:hypothetical protein QYE76_057839 [Lolium multiflorum]
MYGWNGPHDLGDRHHLDTPVWKDIMAGLAAFRSISKVTLGNGASTAFWMDLWLGDQPLHERYPNLFSHSTRPHINVATTLSSGLRTNLGPRLTAAAVEDFRVLSLELGLVDLRLDIDVMETVIWRSAAPLKCKIFCWLARKERLPTNERRFRHHLTTSATCLSCNLDEDTDHLLLFCPRATEVWDFFHHGFDPADYSSFSDFCLKKSSSYEEATINTAIAWNIWKRRNARTFNDDVESLTLVTRRCIQDIRLWAFRYHSLAKALVAPPINALVAQITKAAKTSLYTLSLAHKDYLLDLSGPLLWSPCSSGSPTVPCSSAECTAALGTQKHFAQGQCRCTARLKNPVTGDHLWHAALHQDRRQLQLREELNHALLIGDLDRYVLL